MGDPDDLAGQIFLASKASDFVNGHILYVDGGILATIGKPKRAMKIYKKLWLFMVLLA